MSRNLPPDPGGVFDSDAHRRVLAFLRAPGDDGRDPDTGEAAHDAGIAMSLEDDGWEKSLFTRLNADAAFVATGADIRKILAELEADGLVREDDDGIVMTGDGFDALNGPNGNEPPPMTEAMINAMRSDGTLSDEDFEAWREATEDAR